MPVYEIAFQGAAGAFRFLEENPEFHISGWFIAQTP
jgi:hypothetical protein